MKCTYHPNVEAIGVCINCGKGLCTECKVTLVEKLYCQSCADKVFISSSNSDTEESASYYILPVFFGLLCGVIAFFLNNNYKKNLNRAKNMLGLGIIITIIAALIFLVPW